MAQTMQQGAAETAAAAGGGGGGGGGRGTDQDFPFPFEPYPIQRGFMSALFDCIEGRKIGIFESPTGTGKTQSIVNGCLQWIDKRGADADADAAASQDSAVDTAAAAPAAAASATHDLPAWVLEAGRKRARDAAAEEAAEARRKRARVDRRAARTRARAADAEASLLLRAAAEGRDVYCLEDEEAAAAAGGGGAGDALLCDSDTDSEEGVEGGPAYPRVYFCSRTHTQLAQFVEEMKKTVWWGGTPERAPVRALQLTSRQHVCLNADVVRRSRGSGDRLNDLCKETACRYRDAAGVEKAVSRLRVRNMDLEELSAACGKRGEEACPYYVAKRVAEMGEGEPFPARVFAVPYAALLTRASRAAFGIRLEGAVVVVDEAHNIAGAINDAHSVSVSLGLLTVTLKALQAYQAKYRNRLAVKNKVRLRQLAAVLKGIHGYLAEKGVVAPSGGGDQQQQQQQQQKQKQQQQQQQRTIIPLKQFCFDTNIEGVNAPELCRFVRESRLFQKLQGFLEAEESAHNEAAADELSRGSRTAGRAAAAGTLFRNEAQGLSVARMYAVEGFVFQALVADVEHCRLTLTRDAADPSLSVVCVHAGAAFQEILDSARSVVLAGGTMSPLEDLFCELMPGEGLPGTPGSRTVVYSCGHVVPPDHIMPCVVPCLAPDVPADFRYSTRAAPRLLAALHAAVVATCAATAGGVIVFFPSYAYEAEVWAHWERTGAAAAFAAAPTRRVVVREKKGAAGDVAGTLQAYQRACDEARGAPGGAGSGLLSSVVGGKLSEGINFADHYGRAVIVVGMPYPNVQDPLLKEKQSLLERRGGAAAAAARQMLDVMCMKAVNQSIGRAVRHRGDYAAILLLDQRYAQPKIQALLPGWIKASVASCEQFGDLAVPLRAFHARLDAKAAAEAKAKAAATEAAADAAASVPSSTEPPPVAAVVS